MELAKERLLVIAPHADDEVLGCFGLMNKIKEKGGQVYVLIFTMGGYSKIGSGRLQKEQWKKEFLNVVKLVGIDNYDIVYYKNQIEHLDKIKLESLVNIIESKSKVSISKIKPTIVAMPTIFSTHQDHAEVYKATTIALRAHPQKTSHFTKLLLSYEFPDNNFWSPYNEFGRFSPNLYLQMSKKEIEKKALAMNLYKSQIRKDHRDGQEIIALANIRGNEVGTDYAEAYHVHRFLVE